MTLNWAQADILSIQMDGAGAVWNTGHVAAVLPTSGGASAVVASDTGGVWTVTPGGTAIPVTDWQAPDLTSVEQGPDGVNHVFVGGGDGINLSSPEILVTSSGQVHAFAVGQDHALWHYTWSSGTWSPPESLGQDVVGPPAVCSWGGARVDVFVVGTDGALWHKWFDGTTWHPSQLGYERLGGGIVGQPCAVSWGANRLDVFVIGTDGHLYHMWWDGATWRPSPGVFESLGGNLIQSPVAVSSGPNHLEVFCVRAGDRMLLHKRYDASTSPPTVTDFESLGVVDNIPAVASWSAGLVQVCAVLPDGSMGYKSWNGSAWLPSATTWTALGSADGRFVSAPSMTAWGPNRLDLVSVDSSGVLQHKWFDGTAWGPSSTGWEWMGGWLGGRPALASPAAQQLDLVVVGGDGLLYMKSYTVAGWNPSVGGWAGLTRPYIGMLHETDVTQFFPLLSWREITMPHIAGRIQAIGILPAHRQIVVACDRGVWSSPVPPSSAHGAGYSWTRLAGLPDCTFAGLAVTSNDSFVAAAWGSNPDTGAYGMFRGTWSGSGFTMSRSSVASVDPRLMARTSLAACQASPSNVYAVGCDVITDHAYTEQPDAVCWSPGRIDVFHKGFGADCQHLSWNGSAWHWESLGGIFLSQPRATAWSANRLDVFGIGTDRALYHKAWNGSSWSPGWDSLGGVCVGEPAVCSWGANRLDIFVVGGDGGLYHKWWDGSHWGPSVTGYEPLGGVAWGPPVAVAPASNRLEAYVCGTDGALWRRRWDGSKWVDWERLGDQQVFAPAVVASGGIVHVFAKGSAGNVVHKRWDGTSWQPSATTWDDLGGVIWGAPSAVIDGDVVDVFVRGTDNQIYLNTFRHGAWSGWNPHGGNALGTPAVALESGPRAVSWGPGRRDVFVIAPSTAGDNTRVMWDLWSGGGSLTWGGLGGRLLPAVAPYSLYTFLRSSDGGASFQSSGMYRSDDSNHWDLHLTAGNQGFYNNCATVKPNDARTVVVGWRGGPFLSSDAGDTWRLLTDGGAQHLHGDLHALRFDPTGGTLFVGSDGGLASSADGGATWTSAYNRRMLTLQSYGGNSMAFDASYQVDGLVVTGLQDNGDIACRIGHGEPWRQFLNSDGGVTLCLRTGQILYTNNMNPKLSVFKYGGSGAPVPLTVPKPGNSPDPSGVGVLPNIVNSPAFRNAAGERMMGIGWTGNDLYGTFAHEDGSDIHWEYLGSIPHPRGATITCASSGDGQVIFAGFSDGSIAGFNTAARSTTFHTVHAGRDGPGSIMRLVMHNTAHAFAIYSRGRTGGVLRYLGSTWEHLEHGLPVDVFWSLATDWTVNPPTMFVATESRVYMSTDDGASWQITSTGLPAFAHLNNLSFVQESNGNRWLHASTWGRSVFRAQII